MEDEINKRDDYKPWVIWSFIVLAIGQFLIPL